MPAVPVDTLLDGIDLSRVKCIKIDVEGGEYQVVAGMRKSIAQLPADVTVLLEVAVERLRALDQDVAGLLSPFTSQGPLFRVEGATTKTSMRTFKPLDCAAYSGDLAAGRCRPAAHAD